MNKEKSSNVILVPSIINYLFEYGMKGLSVVTTGRIEISF